jgi:RHS repeat-associated protein
LTEREIYGVERLGTENTPIQLISPIPVSQIDTFSRYLGCKHYELDNHLGSVLTAVSDRKIPRPGTGAIIDHYEADVISANDYYPFGMLEYGRSFNSSNYHFGLDGKLKDNETYGNGNEYDFGSRIYDPRLGRWFSVDPEQQKNSFISPYAGLENSPIFFADPDGEDAVAKIEGNTITVSAVVYVFGSGVTDKKAKDLQDAAMQYYGGNHTVTVDGKTYNVKFDFTVRTMTKENMKTFGTGPGTNYAMLIDVDKTPILDQGRSCVAKGFFGFFNNKDNASTTAHEFGHFLALDDAYYEFKVDNPKGWAGADPLPQGTEGSANYPSVKNENELMGIAGNGMASDNNGNLIKPKVSNEDVTAIATYAVQNQAGDGQAIIAMRKQVLNQPIEKTDVNAQLKFEQNTLGPTRVLKSTDTQSPNSPTDAGGGGSRTEQTATRDEATQMGYGAASNPSSGTPSSTSSGGN